MLDPFAVEDDWFELSIPDFQVRVTERCPEASCALAEFTLDRLHLRDDERLISEHAAWWERYQSGEVPSLAFLERMDPLLARAIRKRAAEAESMVRGEDA